HSVVLCEKSDRLGGALKCEETVPFKKKVAEYLAYQAHQIAKSAIDVRLSTPATPEICAELAPDAIIAAFGARPVKPRIDGIDGANVMSAEDAYVSPDKLGERVVILGAGLVGMELGIYLAGLGKSVELVEMLPFLNNGGNILHQLALDVELKKYDIGVSLETRAVKITRDGVFAEKNGEERFFPADTVIYAVGQAPLTDEVDAIRFCAPEFYVVGDCRTPRNIMQATAMAEAAVTDLGLF
ncbi:MAG: FAD-dependent oxidoreductase, partial [Oscillospiraceae bacterium]|nr:FAD-dependent oxidoreductase [Oscillospiraceae bacterium]